MFYKLGTTGCCFVVFIIARPFFNSVKLLTQASRAQILKKAAEYIQFMRRKNNSHQQDIDDLKRQNNLLEAQSKLMIHVKISFVGLWKPSSMFMVLMKQVHLA